MNELFPLDPIDTGEFARDLAAAAAKQLAKVPREHRDDAMVMLQDATSLWSGYTYDEIRKILGSHPSIAVERVEEQMKEWK